MYNESTNERIDALEKEERKVPSKTKCLRILNDLLREGHVPLGIDDAMGYPLGCTTAVLNQVKKIIADKE